MTEIVANPFSEPLRLGNVSLKLSPTEAVAVKSFAEAAGFTKAETWNIILHTALASLAGDTATVARAKAYVDAKRAAHAKNA